MMSTGNFSVALFRLGRAVAASIALCLVACASADPEASSNVEARTQAIIGGTAAAAGAWPWSVKVYFNNQFQCGGSLIAPDWVLTTAHSLENQPATGYSVQLSSGAMVSASTVIVNPSFVNDQAVTGHFDMGLIRLAWPVSVADGVDFIRPAVDGDDVGTSAEAIGWGIVNHDRNSPELPSQLQQVSLPVVASTSCNNVLPRHVVYPDELCAGFADGHEGVCFGDSGSPLMVQRSSGTWEHIGMPSAVTTSLFLINPDCNSYAIFARTTAMVGWLRQYVPDPAWFAASNLVAL